MSLTYFNLKVKKKFKKLCIVKLVALILCKTLALLGLMVIFICYF